MNPNAFWLIILTIFPEKMREYQKAKEGLKPSEAIRGSLGKVLATQRLLAMIGRKVSRQFFLLMIALATL